MITFVYNNSYLRAPPDHGYVPISTKTQVLNYRKVGLRVAIESGAPNVRQLLSYLPTYPYLPT